MTLFYELMAVHQSLSPLHSSNSYSEQGCGEPQPNHEVVETNRGHVAGDDRKHNISHCREDAADDGEQEEAGDTPLHSLRFFFVEVRNALVFWG